MCAQAPSTPSHVESESIWVSSVCTECIYIYIYTYGTVAVCFIPHACLVPVGIECILQIVFEGTRYAICLCHFEYSSTANSLRYTQTWLHVDESLISARDTQLQIAYAWLHSSIRNHLRICRQLFGQWQIPWVSCFQYCCCTSFRFDASHDSHVARALSWSERHSLPHTHTSARAESQVSVATRSAEKEDVWAFVLLFSLHIPPVVYFITYAILRSSIFLFASTIFPIISIIIYPPYKRMDPSVSPRLFFDIHL